MHLLAIIIIFLIFHHAAVTGFCCSDRLLQVTLWAEHATTFEGEFLAETAGKDEPVIIVFAGMHVRQYLGEC